MNSSLPVIGSNVSSEDYVLFLILTIYKYGLRVSEAVRLSWDDVDFERRRIRIRRLKGGYSAEYPLYSDVLRALRYLFRRRKDIWVFQGRDGHISRFTVHRRFKRYAEKAGIPPEKRHVHVLRHSIATHLLDAGWGIEAVRDALGHRSVQSTVVYAQITSKKRDELYRQLEESRSPAIFWMGR